MIAYSNLGVRVQWLQVFEEVLTCGFEQRQVRFVIDYGHLGAAAFAGLRLFQFNEVAVPDQFRGDQDLTAINHGAETAPVERRFFAPRTKEIVRLISGVYPKYRTTF